MKLIGATITNFIVISGALLAGALIAYKEYDLFHDDKCYGHFDEVFAVIVVCCALRYYGIDITQTFVDLRSNAKKFFTGENVKRK